MSRFQLSALLLALALTVPATAAADAQTYVIKESGPSRGVFVSDAMLDTFKGVSKKVSGEIEVDPNDPGSASGYVELPVESLDTGIQLRNKHLRSKDWMHAAKHPKIRFEITGADGASKLEKGKTQKMKIHGKFSAHGKTREITAGAKVRYEGDKIHVKGGFPIELDDYGVDVPVYVRMKMSNELQIKVDLVAERK